jgi:toxin ParE1/3/4
MPTGWWIKLTAVQSKVTNQPLSGRKEPEYQTDDIRELIEKPYRIIYRI